MKYDEGDNISWTCHICGLERRVELCGRVTKRKNNRAMAEADRTLREHMATHPLARAALDTTGKRGQWLSTTG